MAAPLQQMSSNVMSTEKAKKYTPHAAFYSLLLLPDQWEQMQSREYHKELLAANYELSKWSAVRQCKQLCPVKNNYVQTICCRDCLEQNKEGIRLSHKNHVINRSPREKQWVVLTVPPINFFCFLSLNLRIN